MSKCLRFCFTPVLILAFCAVAWAQSTVTGAIGGTVTNPNKEVVKGATITITNNGTGKEETATSDDDGHFKVAQLQPGEYTVTVNSSGFAPYTAKSIVEVGRVTAIIHDRNRRRRCPDAPRQHTDGRIELPPPQVVALHDVEAFGAQAVARRRGGGRTARHRGKVRVLAVGDDEGDAR